MFTLALDRYDHYVMLLFVLDVFKNIVLTIMDFKISDTNQRHIQIHLYLSTNRGKKSLLHNVIVIESML